MKTYLETNRVYLREFTADDVDLLFDLNSDPDVMKYLSGGKPSTRDEVIEVNNRVMNYYTKHANRFGVWAAHLKSNDEFIGFFILRPCKQDPDNEKVIELGYRLRKKFWRQGFGTEVSQALVDRCFQDYAVDEVFAIAHPDNHGSTGVMKKVGLKFAGLSRTEELQNIWPGENTVRYSLTRDQYNKIKS